MKINSFLTIEFKKKHISSLLLMGRSSFSHLVQLKTLGITGQTNEHLGAGDEEKGCLRALEGFPDGKFPMISCLSHLVLKKAASSRLTSSSLERAS